MSKSKVAYQDIHNENCFYYLQQIHSVDNEFINSSLLNNERIDNDLLNNYDSTYSYANLYSKFLTNLENYFDNKESAESRPWIDNPALDKLFKNDNRNLKRTFDNHLRAALRAHNNNPYAAPDTQNIVAQATTRGRSASIEPHKHTPKFAGSFFGRLKATISSHFKPTLTTNVPTVRHYTWNQNLPTKELRMGTQAQRHFGKVRISPLFINWLRYRSVRPRDNNLDRQLEVNETPGKHVYFNLLGLDRKDFEGKKEKALTEALHQLEGERRNLFVITLPADKGLFNQKHYKKLDKKINAYEAFKQMLDIAMERSAFKIKDFHMSDKANKALFNAAHPKEQQFIQLLNASFEAMGIDKDKNEKNISLAQQQAIWFDFCKFRIPNYVLSTLQPDTWNASCKDAIDRGGVCSAYYNLLKSFETNTPMSSDEFEEALHAAPAMVKGRGLNHHIHLIWNVIDKYVDTHNTALLQDDHKSWLIEWRNRNTPKELLNNKEYIAHHPKIQRRKSVIAYKAALYLLNSTSNNQRVSPDLPEKLEGTAYRKLPG